MLEALSVVLLTLHLLAMNLASAGPLVCLCLRGPRGASAEIADQLGRWLAWLSVGALVLGMLLGGALLYVPPNAALWEALGRFPTRAYWHAGLELAFSLACLLAYAGTWRLLDRRRWLHAALALMAASNLLYHFPPLMAVLGKLAVNPSWTITPVIDRPALLKLLARDDVSSLSIHFALSSLAVAGVTALVLLARRGESVWEDAAVRRTARVTAGIALVATILQLPVGLWVLSTMSRVSRGALMGASPLASLQFLASLVLTLLLAGRLLAVALGEARRVEVRRAGWLILCIVLLMTASMRSSRADLPANALNASETIAATQRVAGRP